MLESTCFIFLQHLVSAGISYSPPATAGAIMYFSPGTRKRLHDSFLIPLSHGPEDKLAAHLDFFVMALTGLIDWQRRYPS